MLIKKRESAPKRTLAICSSFNHFPYLILHVQVMVGVKGQRSPIKHLPYFDFG